MQDTPKTELAKSLESAREARKERMESMRVSLLALAERMAQIAFGEWIICPICSVEFTGGEICPDCNRQQQELIAAEDRIKLACGGERGYHEFTPERFVVESGNHVGYQAALEFDLTGNLYLHGETGTGKSHLAGLIGRRLANRHRVLWIEPIELMRSLRGLEAHAETERVWHYSQVPILIIDELGVSKDTEFALTMLYQIINNRWRCQRNGLVVTSNLSPDQLASKMGDDRLVSRIVGMCRVIEIKGDDHRLASKRIQ